MLYRANGARSVMTTSYDRIAGQSVERLAALSDGIFAVAMRLLVLDLHTPVSQAIHSEHELGARWRGLGRGWRCT